MDDMTLLLFIVSNQNNGQLFVGVRVSGGTNGISGHEAWR